MNPIRVFIIDSHKPSRSLARRVIRSSPGVLLVGEATSPFAVRKAVSDARPHILALNTECRTARRLVSDKQQEQLFELPLISIPKPAENDDWHSIALHQVQYDAYSTNFIGMIKSAVRAGTHGKMARTGPAETGPAPYKSAHLQRKKSNQASVRAIKPGAIKSNSRVLHPLIVIGAPAGDIDAMKTVLSGLESLSTGILVAQQIPAAFDQQYLDALIDISSKPVERAGEGDLILPGKILLAPSNQHIEIVRNSPGYSCHFPSPQAELTPKPSLDLLFASLAENAGSQGIGILLLGVGSDGVEGLSQLRKAGANVLVQERDLSAHSCLQGTSPTAAIMNGGEELIVPLGSIATQVGQIISGDVCRAV